MQTGFLNGLGRAGGPVTSFPSFIGCCSCMCKVEFVPHPVPISFFLFRFQSLYTQTNVLGKSNICWLYSAAFFKG